MNKKWRVDGIPIKRRYQYISIYDGVRQEWCPLNLVVNDLQDELVSTKKRRDELIKQLEDLENKKIVTPWKRFDVENETGDSHMVTMVTEDMYAVINLMNDYNLTWEAVYNIVQKAIKEEVY